jgi:hypothetical protein
MLLSESPPPPPPEPLPHAQMEILPPFLLLKSSNELDDFFQRAGKNEMFDNIGLMVCKRTT